MNRSVRFRRGWLRDLGVLAAFGASVLSLQPFDAAVPARSGWFVPWMAMTGAPPPNSSSAWENPDSGRIHGPYELPACFSTPSVT